MSCMSGSERRMRAYEWGEREHGTKELELALLYSLILRCVMNENE